jgi:hypothetical protein
MLVIFMPRRVMPEGRHEVKPDAPAPDHNGNPGIKPRSGRNWMMRRHFWLAIVRAAGRDKRLIKQRYRQPAPVDKRPRPRLIRRA